MYIKDTAVYVRFVFVLVLFLHCIVCSMWCVLSWHHSKSCRTTPFLVNLYIMPWWYLSCDRALHRFPTYTIGPSSYTTYQYLVHMGVAQRRNLQICSWTELKTHPRLSSFAEWDEDWPCADFHLSVRNCAVESSETSGSSPGIRGPFCNKKVSPLSTCIIRK